MKKTKNKMPTYFIYGIIGIMIAIIIGAIIISSNLNSKESKGSYCGDDVCDSNEICEVSFSIIESGYQKCFNDCGECLKRESVIADECSYGYVGSERIVCENKFKEDHPEIEKFVCTNYRCENRKYYDKLNAVCDCWY